MKLVGVRCVGPGFVADALDGFGVELTDVGRAFGVQPAPAHNCLSAALFERRVVENKA